MKQKFLLLSIFSLLLVGSSFAQEEKKESKGEIKWYGFVRNYFTFDSRESKSGTDELYYYLPLDKNVQADGTDINAHPTMKWTAITSRLGMNIQGYEFGKAKIGGKIEADFYSGLTGVTGTAQFRLRQAYTTIAWNDKENKFTKYSLKIGQAWHPMAADMVHSTALEIGVPFGPFSRTPQITFDYCPTSANFSLTGSAIWQMQYTSGGPEGASANYIKYANTPELYFGVNYKKGGFLGRVGVDMLSIKPRYKGNALLEDGTKYTALVSDRLTTISPFVYAQYKKANFEVKAKSIYAQAGEHMNLNGGYGVTEKYDGLGEDGHWEYTPTRYSSSWLSLCYGKKWQGMLFVGFAKNLGTADELYVDKTISGVDLAAVSNNYLSKNTYANVNQMRRLAPAVVRNWGKLALSFEWQITYVEYGDFFVVDGVNYVDAKNGKADDNNTHWVTNHRLQMMLKYSF